jgi:hypothetical protein
MTTKQKQTEAPAAQVNASFGKAFILNDAELETLKSSRGRKEEESVYKSDVADALKTGDICGVSLTASLKGPWVMAQLRKAAKQIGLSTKDITVYDRSENKSDDHPHGFVAYKVVRAESESQGEDSATESTEGAE